MYVFLFNSKIMKERKQMELKGQIEEIIFSNELNSYTVCSMIVGNNEITATGYLPFVNMQLT